MNIRIYSIIHTIFNTNIYSDIRSCNFFDTNIFVYSFEAKFLRMSHSVTELLAVQDSLIGHPVTGQKTNKKTTNLKEMSPDHSSCSAHVISMSQESGWCGLVQYEWDFQQFIRHLIYPAYNSYYKHESKRSCNILAIYPAPGHHLPLNTSPDATPHNSKHSKHEGDLICVMVVSFF